MLVSKVGDGLAVRLSADDVARLGLKEGDEVDVKRTETRMSGFVEVERKPTRQELIESLRQFRGRMPADFKFDRDEANER